MTLEAALKENTEATRELIEVLTRTSLPEVQAAAGKATKPAPKNDDSDIPAHIANASKATTKPKAETKPKTETKKAASDADAYAPVQAAILDAVSKNLRPEITALLTSYGAKTGKDLSPDVYDEVLGKIAKIVAGESEEELA